jgi:ELWxxDGT repeat protein
MRGKKQIQALLAAALTAGLGGCREPSVTEEAVAAARQPLQGVTLLRDINTMPARFPRLPDMAQGPFLTTAAGVTYLAMSDLMAGSELWKSDGTEAGTQRIKDLDPGLSASYPGGFTELQGTIYFSTYSSLDGAGLWKTDGTPAGTVPVKRFPITQDSDPAISAIATVGNKVLFLADRQLWRSDGTQAGTVPLKSVSDPWDYYFDNQLVPMGGAVFFTVMDATAGVELWKTDGTQAGTVRVADIVPGERTEEPVELQAAGDSLFFIGGLERDELWKTDGTAAGTVRLDNQPGALSQLKSFQGGVLFSKQDRLWRADGAGAQPLSAVGVNVQELLPVGGTAFFSTSGWLGGPELWKTDGTAAGTVPVGDMWPGNARGNPELFHAWQGKLFFIASTGPGRTGLWKSDGTQAGTVALKDWSTNPYASVGSIVTTSTGLLFELPVDESRSEVWRTDGTVAGTRAMGSAGTRTADSQLQIHHLGVLQGSVVFPADDGAGGVVLMKSDGTAPGTSVLQRFNVSRFRSNPVSWILGTTLFFVMDDGVHGEELWKTDGTAGGTALVKDIRPGAGGSYITEFAELGGALYFVANDGVHGDELWKSDGTQAGTLLVRDLSPGVQWGPSPYGLTVVNGALYFGASDGLSEPVLWKSDGTAAGTVRFKEVMPNSLVAGGNTLFFTTWDGELWKSDGTAAGTSQLRAASGMISGPRWLGNRLYFSSRDNTSGAEPWVSDGTAQGTVALGDLNPGSASSGPDSFALLGNQVLFMAYDAAHGMELWRTDGTAAGTARLTDLRPGPSSGLPSPYADDYDTDDRFILVLEDRGLALFAGVDEQTGVEPWVTDGTTQGTQRWVDAAPGEESSTPLTFARVGEQVFFFAGDSAVGREPYAMALPD